MSEDSFQIVFKELFEKLNDKIENLNNKIKKSNDKIKKSNDKIKVPDIKVYIDYMNYLSIMINKYQTFMSFYYIIHQIFDSISMEEIESLYKIFNNEILFKYLILLFDNKIECEKKLDIINKNNININKNNINIIYEYITNLFTIIENCIISLNDLFLKKIILYKENNINLDNNLDLDNNMNLENEYDRLDKLIKIEIDKFYECEHILIFYKNNFVFRINTKI